MPEMHMNGCEGPMGPVVAVSDSETASDYSTATSAITTTSERLSAAGVAAHPMPHNCVHTLSSNTLAALPDTPVIDETSILKWLNGVHSYPVYSGSAINTHIIAARPVLPALVFSRHPKHIRRHRVPRNVRDGSKDCNCLYCLTGNCALLRHKPERFDINQLISALKALNQNEGRVVAADPNPRAVGSLTDNKFSLSVCHPCRQITESETIARKDGLIGLLCKEVVTKNDELMTLRAKNQKLAGDHQSLQQSYQLLQQINRELEARGDRYWKERYDSAVGDVQTHETKLTSVCKELENLKLKSEDLFNENQTLSEDLKTATEEVLVLDVSDECADTNGQ